MGKVVEQGPCPKCSKTGKGKSMSTYDDGSTHCHECKDNNGANDASKFSGKAMAIESRRLNREVCGRYDIRSGTFTGHLGKTYVYDAPILIFNYYEKNRVVKSKVRLLEDSRACVSEGSNTKSTTLFGMQSFTPSKKIPIVIVESEIDAASVNQAMGYPAVATGGTGSAVKLISENIEWLSGWSHVVLAFDNDDAGKDATDKCVPIFEIGKVRVAHWPNDDANELLMKGEEEVLKRCIWNAAVEKPSTIVDIDDIINDVLVKPEVGKPWPFKFLDETTCGMRPGTVYTLAAAEGVGKTEFIRELVFNCMKNKSHVSLFSFEESAAESARRLIGSMLNRKLYLASEQWWDEETIKEASKVLKDKISFYNNMGILSLESICLNIRYLSKCMNTEFVIIDNLTALSSCELNNKSELQYTIEAVGKLTALAKELGICLLIVAHVNNDSISKSTYISTKKRSTKDDYIDLSGDDIDKELAKEGMEWESGRIPTASNIYCGGILRKLSDLVIVLARNKVSDDLNAKHTLKVKILKSRLPSDNEGKIFKLYYNKQTGRLQEEEIVNQSLDNKSVI